MASIDFSNDELVVKLHGIDRILALRMSITVPLGHVDDVRAYPPEADFDVAVRDPSVGTGLFVGGKLAVGTVALDDGLAFFDVRNKKHTLAIDLHHETYRHIVVELDDESPEHARRRVAEAVNAYRAMRAAKDGIEGGAPKLLTV